MFVIFILLAQSISLTYEDTAKERLEEKGKTFFKKWNLKRIKLKYFKLKAVLSSTKMSIAGQACDMNAWKYGCICGPCQKPNN